MGLLHLPGGRPTGLHLRRSRHREAIAHPGLDKLAYLKLTLQRPRPDGLSSQEEFESLCQIEDSIDKVLSELNDYHYVGRNTSAGTRDFFFYVSDVERWKEAIFSVFKQFPNYRFELGAQADSGWQVYREFLYPSAANMERIKNRRVCDALKKQGDKLETAREIQHWAYFPTAESRSAFIKAASVSGFVESGTTSLVDEQGRHRVLLSRTDVPSYSEIDGVTLPLFELAKQFGGEYDGWETRIIRE
jgi:uncharacterized protein (TIGR01619 family)